MATIKYYLRGSKDYKSITLQLSIDRNTKPERKTGFNIHKNNWSLDKALPKQTTAENKSLAEKLRGLSESIYRELNNSQEKGITINGDWLSKQIAIYFNRIETFGQSGYVVDAIDCLIKESDVRKNQKGGTGLSKSRINDYKALKRIWIEFQDNTPIKVKEVNIPLSKKFLSFMLKEKKYGLGYAKRVIGNLKTVCYDAQLSDIKTSPQLKKIDSSQIKNEHIIFLTPVELQKIKDTPLSHKGQINARKWPLIGSWIGQRGNDLLGITSKNFKEQDGFKYIELKQQKTGKTVMIPILPQVEDVLRDGFPYKISLTKFNEHIKKIGELAEINQSTKGILNNPKTNRKELGTHPKWKLLASHVCRRSYCSNMYGKMPTPILMQVSGHSTEKSFLVYCGKKGTDFSAEWQEFIEKEIKP